MAALGSAPSSCAPNPREAVDTLIERYISGGAADRAWAVTQVRALGAPAVAVLGEAYGRRSAASRQRRRLRHLRTAIALTVTGVGACAMAVALAHQSPAHLVALLGLSYIAVMAIASANRVSADEVSLLSMLADLQDPSSVASFIDAATSRDRRARFVARRALLAVLPGPGADLAFDLSPSNRRALYHLLVSVDSALAPKIIAAALYMRDMDALPFIETYIGGRNATLADPALTALAERAYAELRAMRDAALVSGTLLRAGRDGDVDRTSLPRAAGEQPQEEGQLLRAGVPDAETME